MHRKKTIHWSMRRTKAYMLATVPTMTCCRCGKPAATQWRVCADGPPRLLCVECDIGLNAAILKWMGHPKAKRLMADYPKTLLASLQGSRHG